MRNWLQTMAVKFNQFMWGRYGNDELNKALLIAGLVLVVLSYVPYLRLSSLIALALLLWMNVRCLSRNIEKRQQELQRYYTLRNKAKTALSLRKRMWRERNTHRYVKCKQCRAVLRIPKGRGQVEVGCPRCHHQSLYRT